MTGIKVVDTFCFNGEWIVKLRLEYLYHYVDEFIVVEARQTHSGKTKPFLYKDKCFSWFEPYLSKITWLVIDQFPKVTNDWCEKHRFHEWMLNNHPHWYREMYQRDYAGDYIRSKYKDVPHYVHVGDVDEIPITNLFDYDMRESVYANLENVTYVEMAFHYYNFSWIKPCKWYRAYIMKGTSLLTEEKGLSYWRVTNLPQKVITNGGWHFSFFMTLDDLQRKLSSFAHRECDNERWNSTHHFQQCLESGEDLFDRNNERLVKVEGFPFPQLFQKYSDELCRLQAEFMQ